MINTARCHCGAVRVHCDGDPDPVILCHCSYCKRRTGSAFQWAAWFPQSAVQREGETRVFSRSNGDAGLTFSFNFCPLCGTSVWWLPANPDGELAGKIAVAGGCFGRSDFAIPRLSIYSEQQTAWCQLQGAIDFRPVGL